MIDSIKSINVIDLALRIRKKKYLLFYIMLTLGSYHLISN